MGGLTEESDAVSRVAEWEKEADSHLSAWRKEARENYDMVAGDGRQWDSLARTKLEDEGKPCVEFNRLGTIVDAVSGSEVNNRQEVTYIPRVLGDAQKTGVASTRTAAARWVRDNCDAEDEESDAFVDVLVAGIGFTQTRMDYEEEDEGKVVIERCDPLEMAWDCKARKRNLADAKWIRRKCKYTKAEIEDRWPEKADELAVTPGAEDDEEDETVVNPTTAYRDDKAASGKNGYFDVLHCQWYEVEQVYKVLSPEGQMIELPQDKFEVAQQLYPQMRYAKVPRRRYMEAFVCAGIELESGPAPCQHGFTFQAITGKRDRNKGYWYGLVRPMKDPQRWANKFFSQILHIINTNAKGGILVETGAATNIRKLEQNWAKADSVIQLNAGGMGKIMPKPQSPVPPALEQMMEFAITSIRDSSGVNLELLGMVDRQQAGVLEAQRTRAGLTILAPFFDSLRLYRKKQGRVLAYFINEYISDGRLIRVVGAMGQQFVPLMKEPADVDYDVVVDSAPTSRDTKEQAWGALQHILPLFVSNGVPIPPEALDFMPLPESLAAAMKKSYMEHLQKMQQPNPQQQAAQQAELRDKAAGAEQKESAAALNYAKAGQAGIEMAAQVFQALSGQPLLPNGQPLQQPQNQPAPAGF